MNNSSKFAIFEDIIQEMSLVYQHDQRPWMIGFSGGKDSTLLCQLAFEMLERLPAHKRTKKVYIVTSDTMVENPIVRTYMHRASNTINTASAAKAAYDLSGSFADFLEFSNRIGLSNSRTSRLSMVHRKTKAKSI